MCLPHTSHIKEAVMKGVYQYYARVCKHVTSYSYPTIIFLTNCVVELYGIDGILAYQLCFIYLRQLAVQLRTHLVNPSSKSLRAIYNWQYINCLRVWGNVLANYAIEPNAAMRPLIYPYVQICTTVLTITQSPAYSPAKIAVCEFLSTLMYKCQIYIPVATHLIQVLRHPLFSKSHHTQINKHHTHLHNELAYKLHITETLLDTMQYKESIAGRVLDCFVYHLQILADSIFYPEYIHPIRHLIKQLIGMVKVPSILADLKEVQLAMNETLQTILDRRGKFAFSPRDVITQNVNPLSLMANNVAINALNNQAGSSTTSIGAFKQTTLHKLYINRKAKADEADKFARQEAKYVAAKEEVDKSYDNDEMISDDDEEEDFSEEEEESEDDVQHGKKRSRPSNDDDEEEGNDYEDSGSDFGEDQLGDFDFSDDD
eukprot:UN00958